MGRERIILIIPTYNEAENIVLLVRAFLDAYPQLHVVVADSASPDGTDMLVRTRFAATGRVTVLQCRLKQGRGAAVVEAYRWILCHSNADFVGVADADFSHDPRDFQTMLTLLRDAELVIGSRYVAGSAIVNWPLSRRVFSFLANWLLIHNLRVGVRDYTNGYRLFRRSLLERLDLAQIDADGFIMLSQELIQWQRLGCRIVEAPTTFVNRTRGTSHFHFGLVLESLVVLVRLYRRYRRC